MPDLSIITGFLLVLESAFFGGLLAKVFKQPLLLGYLISGLVVSGLLSILGIEKTSLSLLSEVGLALLMFTLGLEFSFKSSPGLKKTIIFGFLGQILISIFLLAFLFKTFFAFDLKFAILLASAFSLSSTAIVVKILQERNELESVSGEIMVGWLLLQDLAVLPLVALLPVIFEKASFSTNLPNFGMASIVLLLVLLIGQKIVPKFTGFVAEFKSRELLLLFVVALVFFFGTLSLGAGFSFAIGAFLAGLVLGQSGEHLAIFSEIRPLRDVFLAIFFVSLGLGLEPSFLYQNLEKIFLLSAAVIIIKIFVSGIILTFFGYHASAILKTAFGLSQVGEFSFALAIIAFGRGYINPEQESLIVGVTLITMVLTPQLFVISEKFYEISKKLFSNFPKIGERFFSNSPKSTRMIELPFFDHVVILGYGRVGKWVGMALKKAGVPYVVVDFNPHVIRKLRLEGEQAVFGDPTDIGVLDYAQVDKAKMIVLAIPDPSSQKMIITNAKELNPKVEIICRSHLEEDKNELSKLGAKHIVQPEFEAALSISHRVLQSFGFKGEEINERIKSLKKEHGF